MRPRSAQLLLLSRQLLLPKAQLAAQQEQVGARNEQLAAQREKLAAPKAQLLVLSWQLGARKKQLGLRNAQWGLRRARRGGAALPGAALPPRAPRTRPRRAGHGHAVEGGHGRIHGRFGGAGVGGGVGGFGGQDVPHLRGNGRLLLGRGGGDVLQCNQPISYCCQLILVREVGRIAQPASL